MVSRFLFTTEPVHVFELSKDMNPFIAMQIIVDAMEKLHSQAINTKAEIIRHEQALQAIQKLVNPTTTSDTVGPGT